MPDGKCVICGDEATHYGVDSTTLQFCTDHAMDNDDKLKVPAPVALPEHLICNGCRRLGNLSDWLIEGAFMKDGYFQHGCFDSQRIEVLETYLKEN